MRPPAILLAAILTHLPNLVYAACDELPPLVTDRVGRAQIFSSLIKDRSVLRQRDIIWGDTGTKPPGVYSLMYMLGDRDPDRTHDADWYQRNHPDWLSYKCDRVTPANEFHYSYGYLTPVDISNPAIRQHLFDETVAPTITTHRYEGIGLDNLTSVNDWGRCGTRHNGFWHAQYTGRKVDPAFANDVADWLTWMRNKLHAQNYCLAVNHYYNSSDIAGYRKVAEPIDIIVDEGGFTRNCKPGVLDKAWTDRVTVFRDLARTKPIVIIDQLCNKRELVTQPVVSWSLATYLLLKGDRTYIAWPMYDQYGLFDDYPELYIQTGHPLGDFQTDGKIYWRRFERVLAIVNPATSVSATYDLGRELWRDPSGTDYTGRVIVPPGTGLVLLASRDDAR